MDFTKLTSRALGGVHSRMCNRLAHVLYVRAGIETEKLKLSRNLYLKEARYRMRNEGNHKTVKAMDAAMALDPEIKKMQHSELQLDVKAVALDAVIKGYESIIKAASREMSRRGVEAGNTSRD